MDLDQLLQLLQTFKRWYPLGIRHGHLDAGGCAFADGSDAALEQVHGSTEPGVMVACFEKRSPHIDVHMCSRIRVCRCGCRCRCIVFAYGDMDAYAHVHV